MPYLFYLLILISSTTWASDNPLCQLFFGGALQQVDTISTRATFGTGYNKQLHPDKKMLFDTVGAKPDFSRVTVWDEKELLVGVSAGQGIVRFYDFRTRQQDRAVSIHYPGKQADYRDGSFTIDPAHLFDSTGKFFYSFHEGILFRSSIDELYQGKALVPYIDFTKQLKIFAKLKIQHFRLSDDNNRIFIQGSAHRQIGEPDSMLLGVFNVEANNWDFCIELTTDKPLPLKPHAAMSADGATLMRRGWVSDRNSVQILKSVNGFVFLPDPIDHTQAFPKTLYNLNTGESTPLVYPPGTDEQLNIKSAFNFSLSSDGKVIWTILNGNFVGFDARTGELTHKFMQEEFQYPQLSPDGSVLFFHTNDDKTVIARDLTKEAGPEIKNFQLQTPAWGKLWVSPHQRFIVHEGFTHIRIFEIK